MFTVTTSLSRKLFPRLHDSPFTFSDQVLRVTMKLNDNNIPPSTPTESPNMCKRIYDSSAVHRKSQAALIRDRLTNDVCPATITRLAAIIAQMESHIHAPLLSVTITSAFPGFQRSMTYQNGRWTGHDQTHHFHDDRALISHSSSSGGVQQSRPLQHFAAPHSSQQSLKPAQTHTRKPAGSPAPPQRVPTPPEVSNCPLTEQAITSSF